MQRAPLVMVPCTPSSRTSRGPGYVSVLGTSAELRLGCVMRKDVEGAYTAEWGWLGPASRRQSHHHRRSLSIWTVLFISLVTASRPWKEASISQGQAQLFFSFHLDQTAFPKPSGLVHRLFFLSLTGPSASSCCSRNFLHRKGHHRSPGLRIRLREGRESQICGHKNSPGGE